MLGKNLKAEIFGTLAENSLYSGFVCDKRGSFRQIYIMADKDLSGIVECTVIAALYDESRSQVRFVAAPSDTVYFEPEIRFRLKKTSFTFEKIVCLYEKSCGAVVYHRMKNGNIKVLLVKNHNGKCWTFPKGHVEINETEQQTAVREIKEETGLDVQIEPDFRETGSYRPFGRVKKQVVFFLARADESVVSVQPSEIDYYLWVTLDEAMQLCRHDNDMKILHKVKKRLSD